MSKQLLPERSAVQIGNTREIAWRQHAFEALCEHHSIGGLVKRDAVRKSGVQVDLNEQFCGQEGAGNCTHTSATSSLRFRCEEEYVLPLTPAFQAVLSTYTRAVTFLQEKRELRVF